MLYIGSTEAGAAARKNICTLGNTPAVLLKVIGAHPLI